MPDEGLIREVEQFLFYEARLLDSGRFHEWLGLFTDDVHYWMPVRRTRTSNELDQEFTSPGAVAYFDDTKEMLAGRVRKLRTGYSWAEDPPSRTRHVISNIEVIAGEAASELTAYSNFIVYRSRAESEQDFYVGGRQDLLRRVDGGLKIARRKLTLDQNVLSAKNVSIFF